MPGFRGADRVYFVRRGLVAGWADHPKTPAARADVAERVRRVFADASLPPAGLTPREAAEILLVARWFGGRERELARTTPPGEWLEAAGAA